MSRAIAALPLRDHRPQAMADLVTAELAGATPAVLAEAPAAATQAAEAPEVAEGVAEEFEAAVAADPAEAADADVRSWKQNGVGAAFRNREAAFSWLRRTEDGWHSFHSPTREECFGCRHSLYSDWTYRKTCTHLSTSGR